MTGTEALLRSGTASLPVSLSAVADYFGIKLVDYAAFSNVYEIDRQELYHKVSYGGFSLIADGSYICVLNSALCHTPRRKWTAAHEIGHILSGHITDSFLSLSQEQEREADLFAADILAPLTVLHFCGVSSASEIERLCGLSHQAAELRFGELCRKRRIQDDIYRTGMHRCCKYTDSEIPRVTAPESVFLATESERELLLRFSPFIGSYISRRSQHDGYEQYLSKKCREPMAI